MTKRTGPKTEPCGTPIEILSSSSVNHYYAFCINHKSNYEGIYKLWSHSNEVKAILKERRIYWASFLTYCLLLDKDGNIFFSPLQYLSNFFA